MRVLDLFSGIGGFALGLSRAGMAPAAFVEIDPFCRRVLAKHWPGVWQYDDVRTVTAGRLAADGIVPELVCGGFPCQDLSVAGRGAGLGGERSGLWFEFERIVAEVRPRWAIIENVPALRSRGLDRVLGGLAALGYDAEWHCVPAAAVGAPHRRDRVWIVACANGTRKHADAGEWDRARVGTAVGRQSLAHSGLPGLEAPERETLLGAGWWDEGRAAPECRWWAAEPDVGRVAHGIPGRVDRIAALGNAIVPQIAEILGRAILRRDAELAEPRDAA